MRKGPSLLFLGLVLLFPLSGEDLRVDIAASLERAKKNSSDLSAALFELGMEEARYRLSLRRLLPSLSLSYSQDDSVTYDSPDTRTKRIALGLGGTVYDRGAFRHGLRMRETELRLKRRLLDMREEDLLLEVVRRYIAVLAYRLRSEILEETLRHARGQAEIGAEEFRLGEITEIDLLSLRTQVKDLELRRARVRGEEARLLFDFTKLLGGKEGEIFRPRGEIDPEYGGFVRPAEDARYLSEARRNSADIEKLSLELYDLREVLRREERPYFPEVSAKFELSMAGRDFPLTRPGFTLGLDFSWTPPIFPLSLGITAGKRSPYERSLGSRGSLQAAENLDGLISPETARANLRRAGAGFEAALRELDFTVREELDAIERETRALGLLREKKTLEERKLEVLALRLDLGEIRRLDYVEAETALAETRIAVLSALTALFNRETTFLRLCGIPGFGTYPLPILPPRDIP